MNSGHHGLDLLPLIALLAAAVVAVPVVKRLGFGSVLGYLVAGIVIGPFGIAVFADPESILQVAELGVVLFLFIIGLEMQPSRLWGLRRQIFGLGLAQVLVCAVLLTGIGVAAGFPPAVALVAGAGFVLTSTAIVMQLLTERGEITTPAGQKMVSILLLEDLMIVPLLALVAFLAPVHVAEDSAGIHWAGIAVGVASIAGLYVAGRYLLNPLFGILAGARAREVLTAAALLVVVGAAWLMELGGLSTAMGAFMAGVLLSESSYRHQLEIDVEPFRGILLGLFFLAVGMSLDLAVVASHWTTILAFLAAYMAAKSLAIYVIARLLRSPHREATDRAFLMSQGGEFAFVLYSAAAGAGLLGAEQHAMFSAIVILSMVATPVLLLVRKAFLRQRARQPGSDMLVPDGQSGAALVIGFGRVGQIASQYLMARGFSVSIIDIDVEMIEVARELGFDVYYGDGTRLDMLHAAGVGEARVVLLCVDDKAAATHITRLLKAQYPLLPVVARSFDRVHSLELLRAGAEEPVRETWESAAIMGAMALRKLGVDEEEIVRVGAMVRERDTRRLQLQLTSGLRAGRSLYFTGKPD